MDEPGTAPKALSFQPVPVSAPFTSRNALSVDVEEWYQVSAFARYLPRSSWPTMESRVEASTHRVLDLLEEGGAKATFFVLGCVAELFPGLVKRILAEGHELASHGWDHAKATDQSPAVFREDVRRTKGVLEEIGGAAVPGYRATSYSIGADNLWALEVLGEEGHRYSSSINPIRHDHYGMPDAPRFPFRPWPGGIVEIPPSTFPWGGANIPCAGGGYFRLYPYALSRFLLRRLNQREQRPGVFFFHPWEIDPAQPTLPGISLKTRFRHRLNLGRNAGRLGRLFRDFAWDRIDRVFPVGAAHG